MFAQVGRSANETWFCLPPQAYWGIKQKYTEMCMHPNFWKMPENEIYVALKHSLTKTHFLKQRNSILTLCNIVFFLICLYIQRKILQCKQHPVIWFLVCISVVYKDLFHKNLFNLLTLFSFRALILSSKSCRILSCSQKMLSLTWK